MTGLEGESVTVRLIGDIKSRVVGNVWEMIVGRWGEERVKGLLSSHPSTLIYGGALRDAAATVIGGWDAGFGKNGGDLDIVSCVGYPGGEIGYQDLGETEAYEVWMAGEGTIESIVNCDDGVQWVEVTMSRDEEGVVGATFDHVGRVDFRCCGLAMDSQLRLWEVVDGAEADCVDLCLNLNPERIRAITAENVDCVKRRVVKLVSRGWKKGEWMEDTLHYRASISRET